VSRIHAGLHTRTDVDAGESIGRAVADAAIARHVAVLDGVARASVARR
jgi:hypothetical protein